MQWSYKLQSCLRRCCVTLISMMVQTNTAPQTVPSCPFCRVSGFSARFLGAKTTEARDEERQEEQKLIEARIREREEEIQRDQERLLQRAQQAQARSQEASTGVPASPAASTQPPHTLPSPTGRHASVGVAASTRAGTNNHIGAGLAVQVVPLSQVNEQMLALAQQQLARQQAVQHQQRRQQRAAGAAAAQQQRVAGSTEAGTPVPAAADAAAGGVAAGHAVVSSHGGAAAGEAAAGTHPHRSPPGTAQSQRGHRREQRHSRTLDNVYRLADYIPPAMADISLDVEDINDFMLEQAMYESAVVAASTHVPHPADPGHPPEPPALSPPLGPSSPSAPPPLPHLLEQPEEHSRTAASQQEHSSRCGGQASAVAAPGGSSRGHLAAATATTPAPPSASPSALPAAPSSAAEGTGGVQGSRAVTVVMPRRTSADEEGSQEQVGGGVACVRSEPSTDSGSGSSLAKAGAVLVAGMDGGQVVPQHSPSTVRAQGASPDPGICDPLPHSLHPSCSSLSHTSASQPEPPSNVVAGRCDPAEGGVGVSEMSDADHLALAISLSLGSPPCSQTRTAQQTNRSTNIPPTTPTTLHPGAAPEAGRLPGQPTDLGCCIAAPGSDGSTSPRGSCSSRGSSRGGGQPGRDPTSLLALAERHEAPSPPSPPSPPSAAAAAGGRGLTLPSTGQQEVTASSVPAVSKSVPSTVATPSPASTPSHQAAARQLLLNPLLDSQAGPDQLTGVQLSPGSPFSPTLPMLPSGLSRQPASPMAPTPASQQPGGPYSPSHPPIHSLGRGAETQAHAKDVAAKPLLQPGSDCEGASLAVGTVAELALLPSDRQRGWSHGAVRGKGVPAWEGGEGEGEVPGVKGLGLAAKGQLSSELAPPSPSASHSPKPCKAAGAQAVAESVTPGEEGVTAGMASGIVFQCMWASYTPPPPPSTPPIRATAPPPPPMTGSLTPRPPSPSPSPSHPPGPQVLTALSGADPPELFPAPMPPINKASGPSDQQLPSAALSHAPGPPGPGLGHNSDGGSSSTLAHDSVSFCAAHPPSFRTASLLMGGSQRVLGRLSTSSRTSPQTGGALWRLATEAAAAAGGVKPAGPGSRVSSSSCGTPCSVGWQQVAGNPLWQYSPSHASERSEGSADWSPAGSTAVRGPPPHPPHHHHHHHHQQQQVALTGLGQGSSLHITPQEQGQGQGRGQGQGQGREQEQGQGQYYPMSGHMSPPLPLTATAHGRHAIMKTAALQGMQEAITPRHLTPVTPQPAPHLAADEHSYTSATPSCCPPSPSPDTGDLGSQRECDPSLVTPTYPPLRSVTPALSTRMASPSFTRSCSQEGKHEQQGQPREQQQACQHQQQHHQRQQHQLEQHQQEQQQQQAWQQHQQGQPLAAMPSSGLSAATQPQRSVNTSTSQGEGWAKAHQASRQGGEEAGGLVSQGSRRLLPGQAVAGPVAEAGEGSDLGQTRCGGLALATVQVAEAEGGGLGHDAGALRRLLAQLSLHGSRLGPGRGVEGLRGRHSTCVEGVGGVGTGAAGAGMAANGAWAVGMVLLAGQANHSGSGQTLDAAAGSGHSPALVQQQAVEQQQEQQQQQLLQQQQDQQQAVGHRSRQEQQAERERQQEQPAVEQQGTWVQEVQSLVQLELVPQLAAPSHQALPPPCMVQHPDGSLSLIATPHSSSCVGKSDRVVAEECDPLEIEAAAIASMPYADYSLDVVLPPSRLPDSGLDTQFNEAPRCSGHSSAWSFGSDRDAAVMQAIEVWDREVRACIAEQDSRLVRHRAAPATMQ
ncbi:hypothetical protein QJQ45_016153 [Haematococcus lacustris]|nr:hypothetical protein QJQ45_016153 [Haematococcus lacustris]